MIIPPGTWKKDYSEIPVSRDAIAVLCPTVIIHESITVAAIRTTMILNPEISDVDAASRILKKLLDVIPLSKEEEGEESVDIEAIALEMDWVRAYTVENILWVMKLSAELGYTLALIVISAASRGIENDY